MTYHLPAFRHPHSPPNSAGHTYRDYEGVISTLCAGCGHDSISAALVQTCYELSIEPHQVAKLSGIGCSSKTPNYFLGYSHGFNAVHGRMPSVATGANLANPNLLYLGVSGDGDTASIGMGQFVHAIRRNLNITYLVENNGCYGLTKGQPSATADHNSPNKSGEINEHISVDLCGLALQLGCGYVARGFSGDKKQLIPLLKGALTYKGFAFVDILSPCVTFNNHAESSKSYDHIRAHAVMMGELDFVPAYEEIVVESAPRKVQRVQLHDGSSVFLYKTGDDDIDLSDATAALNFLRTHIDSGHITTGLLHCNGAGLELHQTLNTSETAFNQLSEKELCPGNQVLQQINHSLSVIR